MHRIAFEAFGVPIAFSTNDESVLERFRDFIPPGSQPCDPTRPAQRFRLVAEENGVPFRLHLNDEYSVAHPRLELALGLLDTHMCGYIAVHAPNASSSTRASSRTKGGSS